MTLQRQSWLLLSIAGVLVSFLSTIGLAVIVRRSLTGGLWNLVWVVAVIPPAWASVAILRSTISITVYMGRGIIKCRGTLGLQKQFAAKSLRSITWHQHRFSDVICIDFGSATVRILAPPDRGIVEWEREIRRYASSHGWSIDTNIAQATQIDRYRFTFDDGI